MRYQPTDRPTLAELRKLIESATGSHAPDDHSEGLRDAGADPRNAGFPVKFRTSDYILNEKVVDARWLAGPAPAPPQRDPGSQGDVPTSDDAMFGRPGRALAEAPVIKQPSGKRKAEDDGGPVPATRRRGGGEGRRSTSADGSGRSSIETAGAGAQASDT